MKLLILNWGRAYLLFKYFYNSNKPTLRYSMRTYTLCSLNGANSLVVKDIFLPNYLSNVLIYLRFFSVRFAWLQSWTCSDTSRKSTMLDSTRFNRITRISIPAHLDTTRYKMSCRWNTSFIMLCKAFIINLYALDCGLNCLFCEIVPNPVEVWKLAVYFFRNRLFFCRSVCEKFCMPSALLYTRVILFRKFSLLMLIVLFTLRRCFQPLN